MSDGVRPTSLKGAGSLNPNSLHETAQVNLECYMCEAESTSREHVPPKCLFPEGKDLPVGVSLRDNLLTVQSCDVHNMTKSHDDEFLLYCLCMNIANNFVAFRQFSTKVMRACSRRPALMERLISESQDVIAVDEAGTAFNTLMVKADVTRINKCFDQIARAMYFYQFKRKFHGRCRFLYDWMIVPDPKNKVVVTAGDKERGILDHVKNYFSSLDHDGSNLDVFKYYFEEADDRGLIALSMQFYGGSNVFVVFMPNA